MHKNLQKLYGYGVYGSIRLAIDMVLSRFFFGKNILIRRPFYIKKYGKIIIGKGFSTGPGLICDSLRKNSEIIIGENVKINHNTHIGAITKVIIGDNVLIASGVYISDHSHGGFGGDTHSSPITPPNEYELVGSPVTIGNNVWIGEHAVILPGTKVGDGSIIGANAVVTKNVSSYTIVAGIPAKPIKTYDFNKKIWVPLRNC